MVWIRPSAITIETTLIEDPAGLRSAHRRIRGRSEPPSQIPVNSERLLRVSSILPMTTGVYGLARGWKFHFFGIYRFQVSAHNNWAPPLIMPLLNYIAIIGLNVNWSTDYLGLQQLALKQLVHVSTFFRLVLVPFTLIFLRPTPNLLLNRPY